MHDKILGTLLLHSFSAFIITLSPIEADSETCLSKIMSRLNLNKYARLESPSFRNGPINVHTGFYIESMDGLQASEMHELTSRRQNTTLGTYPAAPSKLQSLGLDIYMRMSWIDLRLKHDDDESCTIDSIEALKGLWIPDLYFANAKEANFHKVIVPNFILRIAANGTISYSVRITLKTACDMDLVDYPLDYQECIIKLQSYGYTNDRVNVKWFSRTPLVSNPAIHLPEMKILNITAGYCNGSHQFAVTEYGYTNGEFSCLEARIELKRAIGYHLVQTYIPTGLIVMISWVSFWIDVNAVPARVSLSFTTLLTLATQGAGLRIALPPVAYAKAVDYWFGVCMFFVFAALLEFAAVNNLMRRSKKLLALAMEMSNNGSLNVKKLPRKSLSMVINQDDIEDDVYCMRMKLQNANASKMIFQPSLPLTSNAAQSMRDSSDSYARRAFLVDKACRIIFPLSFLTFNLVYWTYYLTTSKNHTRQRFDL